MAADGATQLSNSAVFIMLMLFIFLPIFTWWATVKKRVGDSTFRRAISHLCGITFGVLMIIPAVIVGGIFDTYPVWSVGAIAAIAYITLNIYKSVEGVKTTQASQATSSTDSPEIEAARCQTLAAMMRSTDARDRDIKARAEQPAQNIYNSQYLADIEFDYRDASDNVSHRHVGVEAVDDEYFEGHCYKAEDTRTFVIGRVRGKMLDLDTGELVLPKTWAASVRNDPRNSGVVMNRGWKPAEVEEQEEKPVEILFTGFSKERRRELEDQAQIFDMVVRKNVTQGLTHLCAGPKAGAVKLAQAEAEGVQIIDVDEFITMLKL